LSRHGSRTRQSGERTASTSSWSYGTPTARDRDHAAAENPFTLALSGEHTGFTFERDLAKAENMIRLHSGGENALALRAWRGDRGDARELLATTRGRPTDCAACTTT